MSNRNTIYSEIFVDELARAGLKHVCLAPGSRNTPLVLAFAKHKSIKTYSHLDERSMAFFALGIALALDEPVAIVCTSGSAAANFFPAIVEAHQSRVPLLVLTADRPSELRHSGANQTIDQVKMFGDYALWFVDAALPEANPPALAIRNLRTLAARALAKANGIRKGVVHINLPFRKPLEPIPVESDFKDLPQGAEARENNVVFTSLKLTDIPVNYETMKTVFSVLDDSRRGIVICGPNCHSFGNELLDMAEQLGYPVLADTASGIRFPGDDRVILGAYDSFLNNVTVENPDVILFFGGMSTSAEVEKYLDTLPSTYRIAISESGEWSDASHTINMLIQASPKSVCMALTQHVRNRIESGIEDIGDYNDSEWINRLDDIESTTWETITHAIENGAYFDGAAVYDVVDLIPDESTLFVGNSLAVRHLDQFGKPQNKRIYAYANRGASGIDGNLSTALGAGAARPDKPLVAIVGDVTLYHDMNGLLAVHRCGVPVTLVLLNNNGGGIFHRLPIKDFDPAFTEFFITPHGLDFSHAAKLYGMEYIQVTEREAFRQAFTASVSQRTSTIIEVQTDGKADLQRRNAIVAAVQARLQELK